MNHDARLLHDLADDLHRIADSLPARSGQLPPTPRTLRAELEDLAGRPATVTIHTADGRTHRGMVGDVGIDQVLLDSCPPVRIALFHVVAAESDQWPG